MIPVEKVKEIISKHDSLEKELSSGNTDPKFFAKKSKEYLEIVATNKTPVWDSEQKKYVAEEDKEEKETASLTEEINMMRTETTSSFENDYSNTTDNDDVEVSNLDDGDELPF